MTSMHFQRIPHKTLHLFLSIHKIFYAFGSYNEKKKIIINIICKLKLE